MQQIPLAQSSTNLSVDKFWETLFIYHDRPHLVNRKLLAVSPALICEIRSNGTGFHGIKDLFTRPTLLYEVRKLKQLSKDAITIDFIKNILQCYDKNIIINKKNLKEVKFALSGIYISVRILLPRNNNEKCLEIVVLDKDNTAATFVSVSEFNTVAIAPPFPYDIQLTSSNLRITVNTIEDADTSHSEWLADKLFTKLMKWAENDVDENQILSLSLVSPDDYCVLYADLKNKYGEKLVREWPSKTSTDPQKYIFEDIAISTYLICIWNKYSTKELVTFVDCGCGNGLLVYILTAEGYKGYGLDIRRRPTWDLYPKDTDLRESTVTPDSLFPSCTWILGNHSDELTPWIPVMALKSSSKTNFFVLPCCSYDFSGRKYIRQNTSISQYLDYMNYIKNICEKCNFETKIDKLRIPSTKRTCFIGLQKEFEYKEEYSELLKHIEEFIGRKLSDNSFIPRIESNKPRNCTQLDKNLIKRLVNICVTSLLSRENIITKQNGEEWNKGTDLSLAELSKKISDEDKKQLKKECGGLQTLLRNHKYIFDIRKDKVYLREPLVLDENTKKYKSKPCWFLENHPNGCLYKPDTCAYKHC